MSWASGRFLRVSWRSYTKQENTFLLPRELHQAGTYLFSDGQLVITANLNLIPRSMTCGVVIGHRVIRLLVIWKQRDKFLVFLKQVMGLKNLNRPWKLLNTGFRFLPVTYIVSQVFII